MNEGHLWKLQNYSYSNIIKKWSGLNYGLQCTFKTYIFEKLQVKNNLLKIDRKEVDSFRIESRPKSSLDLTYTYVQIFLTCASM